MIRKNLIFGATLMASLMLMVTMTAAIEHQSYEPVSFERYNMIPAESLQLIKKDLSPVKEMATLAEPLGLGYHPAVSSDGTDMVFAFESTDYENVIFGAYSTSTNEFIEAGGWETNYPPEAPDVDSCGSGRYIGTFVPNYLDNTGIIYMAQFSDIYDPNTWLLYSADLSDNGLDNIVDIAVGGHTPEDETQLDYLFGGYSYICDYYDADEDEYYESTMSYLYSQPDGDGVIYGLPSYYATRGVIGCTSVSMDIDPVTSESYAVWSYDNSGNMDIFVQQVDYGTWQDSGQGFQVHPSVRTKTVRSAGNDNYVDVAALNDNAIIVSERDGAIAAYYTTNGGFTYQESIISDAGVKPRVTYLDDSIATCQFSKNDGLYYSITLNNGETWTTPEKISGTDDITTTTQVADICKLGTVYESLGDIYYEPIDFSIPILQINSVSGGLGITVEIGNVGSAEATDKEYNISVTGGQFNLINKQITGTISIPAGSTKTIETGIIFGLGDITIDVKIDTLRKTVTGKQLLIFSQLE